MTDITATIAIHKVQTLADGGLRWTFDAPESEIENSAYLMACLRDGVVLDAVFKPRIEKKEERY